jgi:hypothetical protein
MSDVFCDQLQAVQDAKLSESSLDNMRAIRNEAYGITELIENGKEDAAFKRYMNDFKGEPPKGIDPRDWILSEALFDDALHCYMPDEIPIVGTLNNKPVTYPIGVYAEQNVTSLFDAIRSNGNNLGEINAVLKRVVPESANTLSKMITQHMPGVKGVTLAAMQKLFSTAVVQDYNRRTGTASNFLIDQFSPEGKRVGNYEAYVSVHGYPQLRRKTNTISAK